MWLLKQVFGLCIIAVVLLVTFVACGSDDSHGTNAHTSDMGSLSFNIVYTPDSNLHAKHPSKAFSSCHEINKVTAQVFDGAGEMLSERNIWDCDAESGTISGIRSGIKRQVVVRGIWEDDTSGETVFYEGIATDLNIVSGETTYINDLVMEFQAPTDPEDLEALLSRADQDDDNYTIEDGDCDDTDGTVYPGAPEVLCDSIDSNCNEIDECYECDEGNSINCPVAHWTFDDDPDGAIVTDTAGDNHGTILGDAMWVHCTETTSRALYFDGDDYVNLTEPIDFAPEDANYTIAFWIRAEATDFMVGILGEESAFYYYIMMDASGLLRYYNRNSSCNARRLTPDRWYHAVLTSDGTYLTWYLDGEQVNQEELNGQIKIEVIGTNSNQGKRFVGALDDIRIYDYALSAEEVRTLFVGVGVTSNNITNKQEFLLTGYFVNSGTNIESITVRDHYGIVVADLDEDTLTWSAEVTLDSGLNSLLIEITDNAGTTISSGFDIGLDKKPPVFSDFQHSSANFKSETGVSAAQLENINLDYPIYIDLENASLNGKSSTDILTLDDAGIPYFRFSVQDPKGDNGISTPYNELKVTMDFKIGSKELVTDRILTPIPNTNDFVIPLTIETLHEDWDNTNDGKVNIITVKCADNAGNISTTKFTYTIYFETPVVSVRSLNNSANLVLYDYDSGTLGGIIQTARTNSGGNVDVNVISSPRPVLAQITGGNYYEMGTGDHVSMATEQQLECMFIYSGEDMAITISPLTHMAASLAKYNIANGADPTTAITEANNTISNLYGVDIVNSYPVNISEVSSATSTSNDNYEYGFLLAGISRWTDDAAQTNGATDQSTYNSLFLADTMASDIALDGLMNGDYDFGAVSLGPSVYRNGFVYGTLDVIQSDNNVTSLDEDDLLGFMVDVTENGNAIYGGEPVISFDTDGPLVVAAGFASGDYFSDVVELNFEVTDMTGVDSVGLYINGDLKTIAINLTNPSFTIDTTEYQEGSFTFEIRATDIQGKTSSTDFSIIIDNVDPVLTISSDSITNDTNFTVTGTVTDVGAGVAAMTLDGKSVSLQPGGNFSEGLSLISEQGRNTVPYTITDMKGKIFSGSFTIDVDIQPAMIEASSSYNSTGRFYSAPHTFFSSDINQNNTTPLYVEYWKTSLDGIPINVDALKAAGYMYFSVRIWDEDDGNGIITPVNDLIIEQQYMQGSTLVDDWHEIPDQVLQGNVVIPITDEIIDSSWKTVGADVQQTIKIRATDKAGNESIKTFTFYVLVEQFDITTQTINQTNIKGEPYSQSFTAAGGVAPYKWSVYSGQTPCDLSMSSDGVLSGEGATTFCSNGTYIFVVRIEDANGSYCDEQYSINLIDPITITNTNLTDFTNNTPGASTINVSGGYGSGHYEFSIVSGSLPTGLTLSNTSGSISGTTYLDWGDHNYPLTVRVSDTANATIYAEKSFTLSVNADLHFTASTQPDDKRYYFSLDNYSRPFYIFWNGTTIPNNQYQSYNGWSYRRGEFVTQLPYINSSGGGFMFDVYEIERKRL